MRATHAEEAPTRYLPTLERARAANPELPTSEPVEQEKWTALVVLTTFLRRTSWREDRFAAKSSFASIPTGAPPVPLGYEAGNHMTVDAVVAQSCPACAATPGVRPCRICLGSGQIIEYTSGRLLPCSCGRKPIACPTCEGTGNTHKVTFRYYSDEPRHLRELLVPSHLPCQKAFFSLERSIEQAAVIELPPPEELRCHDLTGRTRASAYRGGERIVRPTFFGHDFGDTIDRTLEAFKGLAAGSQIIRYDVRAYAWPILRLRFAAPEGQDDPLDIALYCDRHGNMCMHTGDSLGQ